MVGRKYKGNKQCAALKEVMGEVLAMARVLKAATTAESTDRHSVTTTIAPRTTLGTLPPSPSSNVHINVYVSPRQNLHVDPSTLPWFPFNLPTVHVLGLPIFLMVLLNVLDW